MRFLLNGISIAGAIKNALTAVCIFIDEAVYKAAALLLRAFYEIIQIGAKIGLDGEIIHSILQRLMVLAAIYALFRVAVMLITFIIDPSKIKDGQNTGMKIVKNVLIAVILLVTSSFMFEQLAVFETRVLVGYQTEDGSTTPGLIPMIIYGRENVNSQSFGSEVEARSFTNKIWTLFFTPIIKCAEGSTQRYCVEYSSVIKGEKDIDALSDYTAYFNFTPIIPFFAGCVLCYYFFTAVFELVGRIFRLLVLQIVYPIPVILSIDPTQKSDRIKTFFTTYFGIYAQVFIRVATFQLAFVIMSIILNNLNVLGGVGIILKVIIVIGVLQAAKELPKLIEDAIGTKIAGSGGRSFGSVLSGIVGGTVGAIGGFAAGAAGGQGPLAGLVGSVRGAYQGGQNASKAKSISEAVKGGVGNIKNQYTFGGNMHGAGGTIPYAWGAVENFFGAHARNEKSMKEYDKQISDAEEQFARDSKPLEATINSDRRSDELRNQMANAIDNSFKRGHGSIEDVLANDPELMKMRSEQQKLLDSETYNYTAEEIAEDNRRIQEREEAVRKEYNRQREVFYDQMLNLGDPSALTGEDADIAQYVQDYNQYVNDNGMADRIIQHYSDIDQAARLSSQSQINANVQLDSLRRDLENTKETVENNRKAFKKQSHYVRTEKRNEDPETNSYRKSPGLRGNDDAPKPSDNNSNN